MIPSRRHSAAASSTLHQVPASWLHCVHCLAFCSLVHVAAIASGDGENLMVPSDKGRNSFICWSTGCKIFFSSFEIVFHHPSLKGFIKIGPRPPKWSSGVVIFGGVAFLGGFLETLGPKQSVRPPERSLMRGSVIFRPRCVSRTPWWNKCPFSEFFLSLQGNRAGSIFT